MFSVHEIFLDLQYFFFPSVRRDNRGRSLSMSAAPAPSPVMDDSVSQAGGTAVIRTKLQLVDLAGSECVGKSI